jgi:hypothetical protein
MLKDLESTAAALFDGGWRAEDREQLKEEYDFTDDDLYLVCEKLADFTKQATTD